MPAKDTPEAMMAAVADSMKERTGRTLDEWVAWVESTDVDRLDQNEVRKRLKAQGVGQNSQWAIADAVARRAGWTRPSVAEYIDSQYTGKKAALRPIFDVVQAAALALGDDVTAEGRGGYTPFVRRRQFCAVAATTTRIDLGLRFTDPPSDDRLVASNGPGQSTHKIVLTAVEDVDDAVLGLLHTAYLQNG